MVGNKKSLEKQKNREVDTGARILEVGVKQLIVFHNKDLSSFYLTPEEWICGKYDCFSGRHGKMYSFPVSHVFNHKNNFRSYYWKSKFNFSFMFHSGINFKFSLRYSKAYKFPVSWLFDWNTSIISFWNDFNLIPINFDSILP